MHETLVQNLEYYSYSYIIRRPLHYYWSSYVKCFPPQICNAGEVWSYPDVSCLYENVEMNQNYQSVTHGER